MHFSFSLNAYIFCWSLHDALYRKVSEKVLIAVALTKNESFVHNCDIYFGCINRKMNNSLITNILFLLTVEKDGIKMNSFLLCDALQGICLGMKIMMAKMFITFLIFL